MNQGLPKQDIHPCWGVEGWLVYATRRGSHLNTHHGLQRGVLVLQPRRLWRGGAGVLLVVVDWQPLRHSLYVLPQRRDRLPDQEQHYQPAHGARSAGGHRQLRPGLTERGGRTPTPRAGLRADPWDCWSCCSRNSWTGSKYYFWAEDHHNSK